MDPLDKIVAEARRNREQREKGYRERALKLYPHVCGRCSRAFSYPTLQLLEVHHKDHNHDNNPPDGSNWELLCLYCHEQEHSRRDVAHAGADASRDESPQRSTYQPFAGLDQLLKKADDKS